MNQSKSRCSSQIPYSAIALAHAFVDSTGEDRQVVVSIIRRAGRQLLRQGIPTAWHRFDARTFFLEAAGKSAYQQKGMALRLLGFFHWLWLTGLLDASSVTALSEDIIVEGPKTPLLRDLRDNLASHRRAFVEALPN